MLATPCREWRSSQLCDAVISAARLISGSVRCIMARCPSRLGACFCVLFLVICATCEGDDTRVLPQLRTVSAVNVTLVDDDTERIEFEIGGRDFFAGMLVKATEEAADRGAVCEDPPPRSLLTEVWTRANASRYWILLPRGARHNLYFCVSSGDGAAPVVFRHQGTDVFLPGSVEPKSYP